MHAKLMRLRIVGRRCNPLAVSCVLPCEQRQNDKEPAMQTLAISTVLFQAIATVVLVVGVALSAVFARRRTQG